MGKKEEYIPQFDLDKVEETKIEYKVCRKCGKRSVSLFDGLCFECRRVQENNETKIQKELYKKKDKRNLIIVLSIFLGVPSILFILMFAVVVGLVPADKEFTILCAKVLAVSISTGILALFTVLLKRIFKRKISYISEEDTEADE